MTTLEDLNENDIAKFWEGVKKDCLNGCWEWQKGKYKRGYGRVHICRPGENKNFQAHRMSYFLANGPFDYEKLVRHTCDNPSCVRPDHLVLGSHWQNTQDMMERKRHITVKGTKNFLAKLNDNDARDIFALYHTYQERFEESRKGRGFQARLAELYGVDHGTIRFIVLGHTWTHATKDLSPDTFRNVDFLEI